MYIEEWYDAEDCTDTNEHGTQCDAKASEMEWLGDIGVWYCPKCGAVQ